MSSRADALKAMLGRKGPDVSMEKPIDRPPTTPEQDAGILEEFFEKRKWSGLDNHVCHCGAGFLDPGAAVDHWLANHSGWTPPPATDIVDTGLVTPTGDAIHKQVEVDPNEPEKEIEE